MTINYSKQVLLKRGNTEVSSTYTGPLGEVTYDTDLHQLRVHDGERVGGWLVPGGPEYELLLPLIGNAATQQDQINSLLANAIAQQTSLDNLVNEGNVDPETDNETFWFNTEDGRLYIKWQDMWVDSNPTELPSPSYITGIMADFAGNIVPAANVTYSLGTQESQWKDLWVSNNTIYIGNTPISVSNGTLLVDGNVVSGGGGDRLTNGSNEVVLDENGTLVVPGTVTFPRTFTATFDGEHFHLGPDEFRGLTDVEWTTTVTLRLYAGQIVVYMDPISNANNPGYVNNDYFVFTEADHGVPGYTLSILFSSVLTNPVQIVVTPPQSYTATIKSENAIGLQAGNAIWQLGTDGTLTLPFTNSTIGEGEGDMLLRGPGGVTLGYTVDSDIVTALGVSNQNIGLSTRHHYWNFNSQGLQLGSGAFLSNDPSPETIVLAGAHNANSNGRYDRVSSDVYPPTWYKDSDTGSKQYVRFQNGGWIAIDENINVNDPLYTNSASNRAPGKQWELNYFATAPAPTTDATLYGTNKYHFGTDGNITTPGGMVIGETSAAGQTISTFRKTLSLISTDPHDGGYMGSTLVGWANNLELNDERALIGVNDSQGNIEMVTGNATTIYGWRFDKLGTTKFPSELLVEDVAPYYEGGMVTGTVIRQSTTDTDLLMYTTGANARTVIGWLENPLNSELGGNVAEIQFNNYLGEVRVAVGGYGNAVNAWRFLPDGNLVLPGGSAKLGDTFGDGGLTLQSPSESYVELGSFDGNAYIWVADNGYYNDPGRANSAIYISTDYNNADHRWTFDPTGNLTLPVGGDILDSTGQSVLGGGGAANTGNITFDDVTIRGTDGTMVFQPNIDRADLAWTISNDNIGGADVSILYAPAGDDTHIGELIFQGSDGVGALVYVGNVGTPFDNAMNLIGQGASANVKISTVGGDNQWTFDTTGNLILPQGGLIAEGNSPTGLGQSIVLKPADGGDPGQALVIYPTGGEGNHIHLTSGDPNTMLYLGSDEHYVRLNSSGGVRIQAYDGATSGGWDFAPNGSTTLPNGVVLDAGTPYKFATDNSVTQYIDLRDASGRGFYTDTNGYTLRASGSKNWIFGTDGNLTLPGNIQSTTGTGPVTVTSNDGVTDSTWTFGTDGKLTAPGKIQTTDTTNSISTTTGALIVGGGAGIHSDVHIGGTLNITDTTPSTDYTTGALVVAGGIGVNGNINLTGNINILDGNINIQEFSGSTGNFYGDVVTGFNAFYAGKSGFTALPYTVAQFSTASNTYSQINMENTSTGKLASADFVGTADIGTDASWFFDIGIANSGYDPVLAAENNAPGTSVEPLDTYFYVQGNVEVPNTGGNLTIGTSQTGKVVKFIAGGTNTANVVMTIKENGVVVAQNLTAPNLGYAVDVAAANAAIVTANLALSSRVDAANTAIITANSAVVSYVNTLNSAMAANITAANTAIVTANTAMKSYVDTQIASVPSGGGGTTYSNSNVVAYYTSSNNFSVGNVVTSQLAANSTSVMIGNLTTIMNGGLQQINTYVANNVGWWANSYPYSIRSGGGSYLSMGGGTTTLIAAGSGTANTAFAGSTIFNAGAGSFNLFQSLNFQPGANIGVNSVGSVIGITANITHTGSNFVTSSNVTVTGNVTVNGINGVKMPNRPAFRVYGTSGGQITANTTINSTHGATVDFNQGSYYNNTTGIFTAPVAGLYHAYATLRVGTNNGMNQATILKNDTLSGANVIAFWETDTNTGTAVHFSLTGYAQCVAGDTLRLKVLSGNVNLDSNDSWGVTYLG